MAPVHIVVATDGSSEAGASVAFLLACVQPLAAHVHVICAAFADPGSGALGEAGTAAALARFRRGDCEAAVRGAAEAIPAPQVTTHIRPAPPVQAILEVVAAVGGDLVLVGAKDRPPLARHLLGSTTLEVAASARVPVLVTRLLRSALRSVVLAVADPDEVGPARCLATLPLPAQCTVTVARVVSPLAADPAVLDDPSGACRAALDLLRSDWGRQPGRRIGLQVRVGEPLPELLQVVADTRADLLVVGRWGPSWLETALGESIGKRLLLEAPCSVLVVPQGL